MREAMARAAVGDDVYGEDPSVRRLEELGAELLGQEAALFVPTGTMGNQIAIHLLARPGSDVLVEDGSHVYRYELGAMAAWSGASPRVLHGEQGLLRPEQIDAVLPDDDYYTASTGLIVLENTHNHAGGVVLEPDLQEALLARARGHGLRAHLDGARLWNVAAALGVEPRSLCHGFDSVMVSLSKALGAPVGSLLAGGAALVREARIVRKRMGGGMRQAGILAAAGEYALTHHLERIPLDHARAARLARAVATSPLFELDPASVRTNILIASVRESARTGEVVAALRTSGVLAGTMGPGRIRFVTHLDVDDAGIERAIAAVGALAMS
jgi:threonine aldolase